ncbi:MAG: YceH family protein, partial [Candidatus Nitrotoga sp.]
MFQSLTANETRIIACLMEKSIFTPDQYPLTLNALTNACNQKSGRNPVMSLDKGLVKRTARDLCDKHLLVIEENFSNGVDKYKQRFCNSTFGDTQFTPPQFAVVCLLLMRGPQTPGELRAHSGRLYTFTDNDEVVDAIDSLNALNSEPVIVKLPRTPGRKDCEYMHLFSGSVDIEAHTSKMIATNTTERISKTDLE